MAGLQDFRTQAFSRPRIDACGRYLGHHTYWKLYSIENYLRVILHSVLSAQIAPNWLDSVIEPAMKRNVERLKRDYQARPAHTSPGRHDLYYLYLSDLTRIMATTRHLLIALIPDIDSWILKTEGVRIPRNLVGHMNFPNSSDRNRIDVLHQEVSELLRKVEQEGSVAISIP